MQLNLLIILILAGHLALGQQRSGVEEFFYVTQGTVSTVVPRIWWQGNKGWYGEFRYNYEAPQTCSLYGGKTFSGGQGFSWSLTPMVGFLFGQALGSSFGGNLTLGIGKLSMSSAMQYTCIKDGAMSGAAGGGKAGSDFYFSWNELGVQINEAVYAGLAIQQTLDQGMAMHWEPGLEIGLQIQKWVFPLYIFNPVGGTRRFVLGVTREWSGHTRLLHKQGI